MKMKKGNLLCKIFGCSHEKIEGKAIRILNLETGEETIECKRCGIKLENGKEKTKK